MQWNKKRNSRSALFPSWASEKILFGLLILETVVVVLLWWENKSVAKTEFEVEVGKHYSFLIDNERLPIPAEPGQFIDLQVKNKAKNVLRLPPKRVIINFEPNQSAMANVTQPRFLFYFDRPESLRALYEQEKLENLKRENDWESIVSVLHWAHNQFPTSTPVVYPTQNALELLPMLREGKEKGFCAQHCYILVQALQAMGYFARYVTIQGHEVTEAWVPSLKKWVCLDPSNDAYFEDKTGRKLSCLDIRRAEKIQIQSSLDADKTKDLKSGYRALYYWLRNDLYTHPINIYDLGKYRVRAIFHVDELKDVTPGDLFTVYPDELYFSPSHSGRKS